MKKSGSLADSRFPVSGIFQSKILLALSAGITAFVGIVLAWLAWSPLPVWGIIRLFSIALFFWYAAYRTWRLPSTTPSERRLHLAHFLAALWIIFLGMRVALILLDLSPGSMYPLSWLAFALLTIVFAAGIYFLAMMKWRVRLVDVLYTVTLVILLPITAIPVMG